MPVSIKDIAKAADVSPSTVSRALNNHPRISSKTKAYIQELAKTMGYVPSVVARSLVAKRSVTIGVANADLLDPYYAHLISGIEECAAAHNYQVILCSFHRNPQRELAIVQDFHERRMEGIIVTGSEMVENYLSPDNNFFMPIVLVNRPAYHFSVSVDRCLGAQKAVEHLLELGHRHIAYITGGPSSKRKSKRLEGYYKALNNHNIPIDSALVVEGDGGIGGGIKAVSQLLDVPRPLTAITCFNDLTAIGVINGLYKKGYEVPRDFSVTGYDDLEMAAYYHPSLTTVRQPIHQIGQCAVNMLLNMINGDNGVVPEIVDPELVIRQSTAAVVG
jgi:DNA-binding LacI/PurR family transcriptional regulator